MLRVCLFVILAVFFWLHPCFPAELPSELQEKADYALQCLDDTIMRMNSGICRIKGKTIEPNGNVIDDNILIVFDYGANCYRFENGDLKRALLTPDYFYEVWHPGTSGVSVKRSPASAPEATSQFCRLVDIQNIFCFGPVGPHQPNAYRQSAFHRQNKDIKKVEYEELANGLIKVTTVTPPTAAVPENTEYFLDKNNGYTVLKIKRDVGYTFELSWKKINQTWVPVTYVFKSGPKFGDYGVEWKIDWEQVNEKVDKTFFDLDEMLADQEDDVIAVSEEPDSTPTIVGKVGKGIPFSETASPSKNVSYFRYFLVAAGLMMILLALGKKIYDWKTKKF